MKKLAASEKCTAEPPSIRSRSPNGVLTASKAIDPTGAGDCFAGGFLGYLAAQGAGAAEDDGELRRAMTYGSVLGSFCVEEFGTERVSRLTREEIDDRYEQFRRITAIEGIPAA